MRARNIKPSFFSNELIGTLDPIVGMTFIGLWCLADKDGRLEDRPLRIKAELFPYRECTDVNGYLTVLEQCGFIDRYEVDGVRYIQVVNFQKHQSPHHTERPKGYPPKQLQQKAKQDLTVKSPLGDGKYQVPTRSDSLIPDSLIHISTTDVVDKATAKKQPRFDAHRHLMSVGIDKQLADDWLAVRKAKKAAPTKTAIDGIASEANKAGISLAEALAICCQRGWASFKDSWDWRPQGVGQPARPVNGRQAAISNYAAQAAAARGEYESASNVRDITGESFRVA